MTTINVESASRSCSQKRDFSSPKKSNQSQKKNSSKMVWEGDVRFHSKVCKNLTQFTNDSGTVRQYQTQNYKTFESVIQSQLPKNISFLESKVNVTLFFYSPYNWGYFDLNHFIRILSKRILAHESLVEELTVGFKAADEIDEYSDTKLHICIQRL